MAQDWVSAWFRQCMVAAIDKEIASSGISFGKNGHYFEKAVFEKANTREKYMEYVATVIYRIRTCVVELKMKNGANAQVGGGGVGAGGSGVGGQAMPRPVNALQTLAVQTLLARHGTGNNQMMGMGGPGRPGGPIGQGGGGAGGGLMGPQPNASSLLRDFTRRPSMGELGQVPNQMICQLQNQLSQMTIGR